jgi:beta-phosphoglucomutase-like phosphatase (HAD superfamily)
MFKLLSFDVYGTLINTPPINAKAFRIILEEAGAVRRCVGFLSILGKPQHRPLPRALP